jgi:hypothetical protein
MTASDKGQVEVVMNVVREQPLTVFGESPSIGHPETGPLY